MLATCTTEVGESVIVNVDSVSIYFDTETEEMRTCVYPLHTLSLR